MIGEMPIEQKWEISPEMIEKAYAVANKVAQEMAKKQKQIAQEILFALAVKSAWHLLYKLSQ